MPIICIYSPSPSPPTGLLEHLCDASAKSLGLQKEHVWAMWQHMPIANACRPDWLQAQGSAAPIVIVNCKIKYSKLQVASLIQAITHTLADALSCSKDNVFVGVHRFQPGEISVRGEVWDEPPSWQDEVRIRPIGVVRSPRLEPVEDDWGDVPSVIELDSLRLSSDSVLGLSDFSHLEVVFVLHKVREDDIETGARHPRNRADWPRVGILAQRAKRRPNRIAVSRCELLSVDGLRLSVQGLDAIDLSPVLDVKPYYREFGPRTEVAQPGWVSELMRDYY